MTTESGWNEFKCACGHEATDYEALGRHLRNHQPGDPVPPKLEELKTGGLGVTIGYVGASQRCKDGFCDRAAREEAKRAQGAASSVDRLDAQVNAPREQRAGEMVGLGAMLGQKSTPLRTHFTRDEALAVLKAQKATWRHEPTETGGVRHRAALEALDDVIGIFERME